MDLCSPRCGRSSSNIRSERLDRPIVVGHSLGGTLALGLAAERPELVGPLVIDVKTFEEQFASLRRLHFAMAETARHFIINVVLFIGIACPLLSHALRHWRWMRGWIELPARKLVPRLVLTTAVWSTGLTTLSAAGLLLMQGGPWMPWPNFLSIFAGFTWALADTRG